MAIVFIRFASRPSADPRRAPLLERMLARSRSRLRLSGWRAHAYGLLTSQPLPGLGAAVLAAAADAQGFTEACAPMEHSVAIASVPEANASGAVAASLGGPRNTPWVYLACPVHHTAGIASLSLSAGALLRLEGGEAQALALDFNRVFGGTGCQLVVVPGDSNTHGATGGQAAPAQAMSVNVSRGKAEAGVATFRGSSRLLLVCPGPVRADTQDPEDALGGDLWEFQPSGPDAAYLRGLMSEVEMWLFDHPANQHRVARGDPAITGLWLWGGGARLAALPEVRGWTAGEDPFFAAFATADPRRPTRGDAGAHEVGTSAGARVADDRRESDRAERPGSGVVVLDACPGTPAWDEAESRWLRPALARLRSGGIERLELSAGQWLFRIDARWRRRIWRKTLPWWETLR